MRSAILIGIVVGLLPQAASGGPGAADVEARMVELQREVQARMAAEAWDAAADGIRRMAALDADHPKPFLQAIILARRIGGPSDPVALLDELGLTGGPGRVYGDGLLAYFGGDMDEAFDRFTRALETYQAADHPAGQATCHVGRGNVLRKDKARLDEAVAEYEAARGLVESLGDRYSMCDVLALLAKVERRRGEPRRAAALQREVLSLREEIGDEEGQARSLHEIGICLQEAGEHDVALEAFDRALRMRRTLGDARGQINTAKALSTTLHASGNPERAVVLLKEALEVAESLSNPKQQADISRMLAELYVATDRTREAVAMLESTAELYRGLGAQRRAAEAERRLGTALARLGEFLRARGVLLGALDLARASGSAQQEAIVQLELGNVDLAVGELTHSLLSLGRALELFRQIGDRTHELISLNVRGVTHHRLGRADRARRDMEAALRLAEEVGNTESIGRGHNNLAVLLFEEGRTEASLEELRKAEAIWLSPEGPPTVASNLADALAHLGRGDEAEAQVRISLQGFRELGDREGEAYVLNQLGELRLAGGAAEAAREAHAEALELARGGGLVEEEWRAHAGLAAALEASGQREAAFAQARLVLDGVERVRARLDTGTLKMRFLAARMEHYEHAIALALPAGPDDVGSESMARSFALAERARARSLLDLLAESRSRLRGHAGAALEERESDSVDRVSAALVRLANAPGPTERVAARQAVDAAEEELERVELEIRRTAPRYGAIVYPRTASLEHLQREILAPDEILLEYFVGSSRAWLWVVDRRAAEVHELPSPEVIRADARAFLEALERSRADLAGGAAARAAAERLARDILPPGPLPRGRRLLVAPDGPLHHVPFEALRVQDRFLIEEHEIAVIPSATALDLMRTTDAPAGAGGGFLGVADPVPVQGDVQFARLPFARRSVEKIAALFPEPARKVLIGEEATKARIEALDLDGYGFLHFAVHGWLDAESPRRSGLRLSPVPGDPGSALLAVDEILGLRMSAGLVVLSACRSGVGEAVRGEGVVGLTRAFLYAGSRGVVVSLWNVGDQSTGDLMLEFYRGIRAGESPSRALRNAKLGFLASDRPARRRPWAWAPFVLVGVPGEPGIGMNPVAAAPTE